MVQLSKSPIWVSLLDQANTFDLYSSQPLVSCKISMLVIWFDLKGSPPQFSFGDNTLERPLLSLLPGSLILRPNVAGASVAFNVIGTIICLVFLICLPLWFIWFASFIPIDHSLCSRNLNITTPSSSSHSLELGYFRPSWFLVRMRLLNMNCRDLDESLITQAPSIALGKMQKRVASFRWICRQSF